jgi:hypothetical protein
MVQERNLREFRSVFSSISNGKMCEMAQKQNWREMLVLNAYKFSISAVVLSVQKY